MNIKAFSFIQHQLIPMALIAGNIALAHLIYLIANGDDHYTLWATVICITALTIGILRSNRYLLIGATVLYSIVLLVGIFI